MNASARGYHKPRITTSHREVACELQKLQKSNIICSAVQETAGNSTSPFKKHRREGPRLAGDRRLRRADVGGWGRFTRGKTRRRTTIGSTRRPC